jgi:hypothetical protein
VYKNNRVIKITALKFNYNSSISFKVYLIFPKIKQRDGKIIISNFRDFRGNEKLILP